MPLTASPSSVPFADSAAFFSGNLERGDIFEQHGNAFVPGTERAVAMPSGCVRAIPTGTCARSFNPRR